MTLAERLSQFFAPTQSRISARTAPELNSWEQQLARVQRTTQRPWRGSSVREALGVPAVNRAVTLISNTAGALSMKAYRNGTQVAPDDRPRLAVRPNPLTTPRVFWRDSAFWKACYGEQWWWVPVRDSDGYALSLYPVPPYEIRVEENSQDRRYPNIWWRNRLMPQGDMLLETLLPDPSNPFRGIGPLQLCGAAVSVAVEAQEWASNFFASGGFPNIVLQADYEFQDEQEPTLLKTRWTANPPNTPHVIGGGLEAKALTPDQQGAQMLDARLHQNGEVALMFGIPGTLLEHGVQGGSITYQNVAGEFDKFVKACLWPNYLEGSEQQMTDLLPRSWTTEFDTNRFTRPDPKTRHEIYKLATEAGLPWAVTMAAREEGEEPGSIETAAMPPSPPQAIPSAFSVRTMEDVRCQKCNRLVGRVAGDAELFCRYCKSAVNHQGTQMRAETEAAPAPFVIKVESAAPTINYTPPPITVTMPDLPDQPAPIVNVTVQPADVPTIINQMDAPTVTVENRVETPVINNLVEVPTVNITVPETPVTVNLPEQPAPVVNLAPVLNVPKQAAPVVNVTVPEREGPQDVRVVDMPERNIRSTKRIKRDRTTGLITEVTETGTETDG